MKLFKTFEAVSFPEEDMIFITQGGYLYYIYSKECRRWSKHRNAGYDSLTVSRYPDVSMAALTNAMHGVFPRKETDFLRLCDPYQLCVGDMLELLREDHARYMSDRAVCHTVHLFLSASNICHKSFERIQKLLRAAAANHYDSSQVITQIEELSLEIIGRDIFKREIGIVDGHNGSSYFWIMPVRIIDYSDTDRLDNVAKMKSAEISIEEDDVARYLSPFLYQHFDEELKGNQSRGDASGFDWYMTHNFFTFDSVQQILKDIADTADALMSGQETEYTKALKTGRGAADTVETDLIVDFYRRFLYRMEYMMRVGAENGYDLISFMGP